MYGRDANALGFGPNRGLGWAMDAWPGHSPLEAMLNSHLNSSSLHVELLGWSVGSLTAVALVVFAGFWKPLERKMLAVIALVWLAFAVYWGNGGPDFGARYWYLMLIPLLVLAARGFAWLHEQAGDRALLVLLGLCFMAVVNYVPWRAFDKYHHYLNMRPEVPRLAATNHFGRSLVLVRGLRQPDYHSAAFYNPLEWNEPVPIYAWDRDAAARNAALQAYPDRPVWILDGPTRTGAGYRIVAGPLTSEQARNAP
jgi:hypothetical protein